MAQIEISLPAIGEGIIEAEITRWLVAEGEKVQAEQSVVEIATDKVDSEVPAADAGVLVKILIGEGETAKIGQVLAIVETDAEAYTASTTAAASDISVSDATTAGAPETEPPAGEMADSEVLASNRISTVVSESAGIVQESRDKKPEETTGNYQASSPPLPTGTQFLSPAVRTLIKEQRLSDADISRIKGTGGNGRIIIADIRAYLAGREFTTADSPNEDNAVSETSTGINEASEIKTDDTNPEPDTSSSEPDKSDNKHENPDEPNRSDKPDKSAEPDKPDRLIPDEIIYGGPENEIIEMDRTRRIIARHMSYSKQVSPHVNSFIETDVTDLVYLRNSIKDGYLEKHGQRVTITPMILSAVIRAIKDFPLINVSVDGEKIILKKDINIGMATALRDGNLIVPVIKDADKLSFKGLVSRVNDLADRSRDNQLRPDEIQGGTFTVTNLGPFGSLSGTPIIHQPEAAILALGAIKKKPAVVEKEGGDAIGIRHIMIMCLAYDHRVIDGALGGMFLKRISDILEKDLPEVTI